MIIIPSLDLVFIHVHKNAGKSVRNILKRLSRRLPAKTGYEIFYNKRWNGVEVSGHMKAAEIISRFPELSGWFKFSISRNTWDRIASSYFWIKSKPVTSGGFNALDLKAFPTFESYVCRLYDTWRNMEEKERVLRFYALESRMVFSDRRIIYPSQCYYFWDNFGNRKMLVDRLCRFEFLEKDLFDMLTVLGAGKKLRGMSLKKVGASPRDDYRKAYTSRMVEMIAEIYKDEINF